MKPIALAAIAGAHGIKGEVRLRLFGEGVSSLASGKAYAVGARSLTLLAVRAAGKGGVARFEGIVDRGAAEALRGSLIEVDRAELPPLAEGEYYHADIVGRDCIDALGHPLGTVVAVENYGAGDLLDVKRADGKTSLIPFRPGIADLAGEHIVLDPDFLA